MGMNGVISNKFAMIERSVNRIDEVYEGNPENLLNLTKQDSIILNILRATEVSIDLAMHLVSERKLGIPKTSGEAFKILKENDIIEEKLAKTLMNMVGFRNIAVHDYQALELDILEAILAKHVGGFYRIYKGDFTIRKVGD